MSFPIVIQLQIAAVSRKQERLLAEFILSMAEGLDVTHGMNGTPNAERISREPLPHFFEESMTLLS
jgi:hypothetical protein